MTHPNWLSALVRTLGLAAAVCLLATCGGNLPSQQASLRLSVKSASRRSLPDFDCVGINVMGPGVLVPVPAPNGFYPAPLSQVMTGSVCSPMGIVSKMLALSGTEREVTLQVPTGVRLIQLLGLVMEPGNSCPTQQQFFGHLGSADPLTKIAGIYELGREVRNLESGPNEILMTASYDTDDLKDVRCDTNRSYTAYCAPSTKNNISLSATGAGTSGSPYEICSTSQFNTLMSDFTFWDKQFKLSNHLTLSSVTPIGNTTTAFSGVFDGDNYSIKYSYTVSGPTPNQGLFGVIRGGNASSPAIVKNLRIVDSHLTGDTLTIAMGLLAGQVGQYGQVEDSSVESTNMASSTTRSEISGYTQTGGLVGVVSNDGAISRCTSKLKMECNNSDCGGLVGTLGKGSISSSYSQGAMKAVGANLVSNVGGLIGSAGSAGAVQVSRSASAMQITTENTNASTAYGGFVGQVAGAGTSITVNFNENYATGDVNAKFGATGANQVGGFAGALTGGASYFVEIFNSYSTGRIIGLNYVGGFVGTTTSNVNLNGDYSAAARVESDATTTEGDFVALVSAPPSSGCLSSTSGTRCIGRKFGTEDPPASSQVLHVLPAALLLPVTWPNTAFGPSEWTITTGALPRLVNGYTPARRQK